MGNSVRGTTSCCSALPACCMASIHCKQHLLAGIQQPRHAGSIPPCIDSLTHTHTILDSSAHSLTNHSLTDWLTHSLSYSLTYSLTRSNSFSHSPTHPSTSLLTHPLTHPRRSLQCRPPTCRWPRSPACVGSTRQRWSGSRTVPWTGQERDAQRRRRCAASRQCRRRP